MSSEKTPNIGSTVIPKKPLTVQENLIKNEVLRLLNEQYPEETSQQNTEIKAYREYILGVIGQFSSDTPLEERPIIREQLKNIEKALNVEKSDNNSNSNIYPQKTINHTLDISNRNSIKVASKGKYEQGNTWNANSIFSKKYAIKKQINIQYNKNTSKMRLHKKTKNSNYIRDSSSLQKIAISKNSESDLEMYITPFSPKQETPNLGTSNFADVRIPGRIYVDKTLFIKEIIENAENEAEVKVKVFTRPTRFGKSLNVRMLEYYLDYRGTYNPEKNDIFRGLKIQKILNFSKKHQKKYMVISLDFLSLGRKKYDDFKIKIKRYFAELYDIYHFVYSSLKKSSRSKTYFKKILDYDESDSLKDISDEDLKDALKNLLKFCTDYNNVYEKLADDRPIVLIDEYDSPLVSAKIYGFWEEAIELMRTIILSAFKGNDKNYVKAVITGVTRLAGEKMFSPMGNNAVIYSLTNERYCEYFGLNEEELDKVLHYSQYNDKKDIVLEKLEQHYGHYYFGKKCLFNPWSVFQALFKDGNHIRYERYWLPEEQGKYDLCAHILKNVSGEIQEIIKDELLALAKNEIIELPISEWVSIQKEINLDGRTWFYSLLYLCGFITRIPIEKMAEGTHDYYMMIPNFECQLYFTQDILPIFGINLENEKLIKNFESRKILIKKYGEKLFNHPYIEKSFDTVSVIYTNLLYVCGLFDPNKISLDLLIQFSQNIRKEDEISRFVSMLRDNYWVSYEANKKIITFNGLKIHSYILNKMKSEEVYFDLLKIVFQKLKENFIFELFNKDSYRQSYITANHLYSVILQLDASGEIKSITSEVIIKLMKFYLYYEINTDKSHQIYMIYCKLSNNINTLKIDNDEIKYESAIMYSLYAKLQCKLNNLNSKYTEIFFKKSEELFSILNIKNVERILNLIRLAKYYRIVFQYEKALVEYEKSLQYCSTDSPEFYYINIEKIFIQSQIADKNFSFKDASKQCIVYLNLLKKYGNTAFLAKAYTRTAFLRMTLKIDDPQIKLDFEKALVILKDLASPEHIEFAKVECVLYYSSWQLISPEEFLVRMENIKKILDFYYLLFENKRLNIIYLRYYFANAEYYLRTGVNFPEAKVCYQEAKALLSNIENIIRQEKWDLKFIKNLILGINNNLAEINRTMGNMKSANIGYISCFSNGKEPDTSANVELVDIAPLNNLAELAMSRGEFETAKQKLELIINRLVKVYGKDHISTYIVDINMLVQSCYRGDIACLYGGIDNHLLKLEAAYENSQDGEELAKIAYQLCEVCLFIGNIDYAKEFINCTLKFYSKKKSKNIEITSNPVYGYYKSIASYINIFFKDNTNETIGTFEKTYKNFIVHHWLSYPDYYNLLYYVCLTKYSKLDINTISNITDNNSLYNRPIKNILKELKDYLKSEQPYFLLRYAQVCLLEAKINYLQNELISSHENLKIAEDIYYHINNNHNHFKLSEIFCLKTKLNYKLKPNNESYKENYDEYKKSEHFPYDHTIFFLSCRLAEENMFKPMSINYFKKFIIQKKSDNSTFEVFSTLENLIKRNEEQYNDYTKKHQRIWRAELNFLTQLITLNYLSKNYEKVLKLLYEYENCVQEYIKNKNIKFNILNDDSIFLNLIYSIGFVPTHNGRLADLMLPFVESMQNNIFLANFKVLHFHNLACLYNIQSEEDRLEGVVQWKSWYKKSKDIFLMLIKDNHETLVEYIHILYQKKKYKDILKYVFTDENLVPIKLEHSILTYDFTESSLLSQPLKSIFDHHNKLEINAATLFYFLLFMTLCKISEHERPILLEECIKLLHSAIEDKTPHIHVKFLYVGSYLLGCAYETMENETLAKKYFEESKNLYEKHIDVYLLKYFPKNIQKYKNSYFFSNKRLKYVTNNIELKDIQLNDVDKLENELKKFENNKSLTQKSDKMLISFKKFSKFLSFEHEFILHYNDIQMTSSPPSIKLVSLSSSREFHPIIDLSENTTYEFDVNNEIPQLENSKKINHSSYDFQDKNIENHMCIIENYFLDYIKNIFIYSQFYSLKIIVVNDDHNKSLNIDIVCTDKLNFIRRLDIFLEIQSVFNMLFSQFVNELPILSKIHFKIANNLLIVHSLSKNLLNLIQYLISLSNNQSTKKENFKDTEKENVQNKYEEFGEYAIKEYILKLASNELSTRKFAARHLIEIAKLEKSAIKQLSITHAKNYLWARIYPDILSNSNEKLSIKESAFIEKLITDCNSSNDVVTREYCVENLGKLNFKDLSDTVKSQVIDSLIKSCDDEDSLIIQSSLEALGKLCAQSYNIKAIEKINSKIDDSNHWISLVAINALITSKNNQQNNYLIIILSKYLNDNDPWLRQLSVNTLIKLDKDNENIKSSILAALALNLNEKDSWIKINASETLKEFDEIDETCIQSLNFNYNKNLNKLNLSGKWVKHFSETTLNKFNFKNNPHSIFYTPTHTKELSINSPTSSSEPIVLSDIDEYNEFYDELENYSASNNL
jgi:hypothetical protein